jgi:hypothetical protein
MKCVDPVDPSGGALARAMNASGLVCGCVCTGCACPCPGGTDESAIADATQQDTSQGDTTIEHVAVQLQQG